MLRGDLEQRTVEELKSMLRDRNLKIGGRKSQLVDRLISYFNTQNTAPSTTPTPQPAYMIQSLHPIQLISPMQSVPSVVCKSTAHVVQLPTYQSDAITFYDAEADNGLFSNYWSIPGGMIYRGVRYPTSEHAFQAAKFDYMGASERSRMYAVIISKTSTPNKARILALQKTGGGYKWRTDLNSVIEEYSDVPLRPDWEEVKLDVMREILRIKFTSCQACYQALMATDKRQIIEASPRDSYWGWGKDCKGCNHLGSLLIEQLRTD